MRLSLSAAAQFTVLAALGICSPTTSQVPDGSLVVSSLRWSPQFAGPGGLWYVDVHGTTGVTPVTGLPTAITCVGSDYVLRRPSDGVLIAGGGGLPNTPISLFVMQLNGTAVTPPWKQYNLATVTSPSTFGAYAVLLPDERVLVAIDTATMAAPGPLAGALLGIVDPSVCPGQPGDVTPINVAPIPAGQTRAVALDLSQGVAYVSMVSAGNSQVYSIPYPVGGMPRPILPFPQPGAITSLVPDGNGQLLAGQLNFAASQILRINPLTGAVVPFPLTAGFQTWAIRRETVTGDLYFVDSNSITLTSNLYRLSPASTAGVPSLVTTGPPSGWGRVAGIDINPDPEPYGAGSGGPAPYTWALSPNAGGLPTVGSAGFSLQVSAPAAPLSLFLMLGIQRVSVPIPLVPPLQALVLPVVTLPIIPLATLTTIPLPIPPVSSVRGTALFGQTLHIGASGNLGTSPGVHFTIL